MNKKKAKKDSMKKKSDEQQTESSSSSSCAVENDLFDYFEAQEFQIDETKESVEMKSQLRRIIKRRNKIYYRVQKKMNVIKNLTLCTDLEGNSSNLEKSINHEDLCILTIDLLNELLLLAKKISPDLLFFIIKYIMKMANISKEGKKQQWRCGHITARV